ncbi:hypothetical protein CVT26_013987 [Gymnopilus dilepis]|uniref:Distal membrane-arm assembly complex protein 1-like domain-containing protein n=1 Tax=Gymnopilus dilepis TaxID=231916 RepID=A0A409VWA5_9AGAR|nr:hypothetical protein CVT26_013987 [Gymnopilus dilepis]
MTRDASSANQDASQDLPKPQECLSCRIMGTGVLAGTGAYAIWQSRAAAAGTPFQKKTVAAVGMERVEV